MTTKTPTKTKTAPAKKPAATGESPVEAKITVLVEANPKKEGSAAHTRFALYKSGMSVGEFLAAGGTRSDIRWDSERKFIEVA